MRAKKEALDLSELLNQYYQKNKTIFSAKVGDTVFFCTFLGRRDYNKILKSRKDYLNKEVEVCKICTVYPEHFNFQDAPAGLPTKLCEIILKESYLDTEHPLKQAFNYFRKKLDEDEDTKVNTIIHEAFPEFTPDEIADWDILKTADYMTRSEFVMNQLRANDDLRSVEPEEDPYEEDYQKAESYIHNHPELSDEEHVEPETSEIGEEPETKIKYKTPPKTKSQNTKLTPQKLCELQMRYPDIDWAHDSVAMNGISALQNQHFDDRPIAEIPIDDSEEGQNAIPLALRNRFKVIKETN